MEKYILTKETKQIGEHTLYRIQAVRDFGKVKKGDKGGWIASEENLSHHQHCWVFDNALIYGKASVHGNAEIHEDAKVYDNAEIFGNTKVYGNPKIHNEAKVYGNAKVSGKTFVGGNAKVYERAQISDTAEISGKAEIHGDAWAYGNAEISGKAKIFGNTTICGNAHIQSDEDAIWIDNVGSENDVLTAYRTKKGNIELTRGCFNGSPKKFKRAVKEKHGGTKHEKNYLILIKFIEKQFGTSGT